MTNYLGFKNKIFWGHDFTRLGRYVGCEVCTPGIRYESFVFLQGVCSNFRNFWKFFGTVVLMIQWELEGATGTVGKVFA